MEDFTGGTIQNQPSRRLGSLGPDWDARVRRLVGEWGADKNPELIEEMIVTALKIGRDQMGVADLKLLNRSLKSCVMRPRFSLPTQNCERSPSLAQPGRRRKPCRFRWPRNLGAKL